MILNTYSGGLSTSDATIDASEVGLEKTAYGTGGLITGQANMLKTLSTVPSTFDSTFIIVNNVYYKWSIEQSRYVMFDTTTHLRRIVAVPSASTYAYGTSVSATVTAYYSDGTSGTVQGASYSPTTATSEYITVSYTSSSSETCTYKMKISIIPTAAMYTDGTAVITPEADGKWKMELQSSGTLTTAVDMMVDIYCLGGGGAGGYASYGSQNNPSGGGGGGYTDCAKGFLLKAGTYNVLVGSGGTGSSGTGRAASGGTSSITHETLGTIISSSGGEGGGGNGLTGKFRGRGGFGGSGGGGGVYGTSTAVGGCAGGSDGSNGQGAYGFGTRDTFCCRDFWESGGTLRSGGGGGCSATYDDSYWVNNGGAGGGGQAHSCGVGGNAEVNKGGGGGAGTSWDRSGWSGAYTGGNGSSGIIIIRSAR